MYRKKDSPREDHRLRELQRAASSASLAESFPTVSSLTVELAHFRPERPNRNSPIKYTVNLAKAKSVLLFNCPNDQCVGGDFDLSAELAKSIKTQARTVAGEVTCQGWRNDAEIDKVRCHNVLRYKLTVGY